MENFVLNGIANGPIAEKLMAVNWDVGALRPWMGKDKRTYITVCQNGTLKNVCIGNATTTLRQYDWKQMDKAVVQTAKQRLKAVSAIRAAGLTYNIPNGMAKTVLETETVSDLNDAEVTMDALHKGAADRPVFEVSQLPLPIHHYDFHYSARQIQASRNGGSPLDTTTAELAGRKVAESIEKMLLGKLSTYTFGGGTIYGFTNYTSALTKTITSPATSGWTGSTIVTEMLAARQQSMDAYHYGPWILLTAPSWDQYLDQDYSSSKGDNTVRDRLAKISGIQSIITCDYLTSYEMVLVQLSTDVCRLIEGMDITTVQWESDGGFLVNFKVMAIVVPQLRADQNSNTGIVYMST